MFENHIKRVAAGHMDSNVQSPKREFSLGISRGVLARNRLSPSGRRLELRLLSIGQIPSDRGHRSYRYIAGIREYPFGYGFSVTRSSYGPWTLSVTQPGTAGQRIDASPANDLYAFGIRRR